MTTITQSQLVAPMRMAAADSVLYTVPAGNTAKLGRVVFVNTTASPVTIIAGISTGGVLTPATMLIFGRTVAPSESYVSPELAGAVLPAGSQLRGYASATSSITFTASGLLIQ